MSNIKIILAQLDFTAGDLRGNCQKMLDAARKASQDRADLIAFPELSLTGYSPEDLLLHQDFLLDTQAALNYLRNKLPENIRVIVGYAEFLPEENTPEKQNENQALIKNRFRIYNSAAVIYNKQIILNHRKQSLPNYGVFDEKRYFQAGNTANILEINQIKIGLLVCEDLWVSEPAHMAKAAGAEILLSINASPYDNKKIQMRYDNLRERIIETHLPIIYLNHCTGQDDIIFDGSSCILDNTGKIAAQAPFCEEILMPVIINKNNDALNISSSVNIPSPEIRAQLYQASVFGVREYAEKNKFSKIIIGFSGGIDSSLTLAIAADAIGKENIIAAVLPSRYTSELSLKAAHAQLNLMGIAAQEISIEPAFRALLTGLNLDADNPPATLTTQNLQARVRGVLLMALANTHNGLLLNTSNKSEIATGYGTLYGDMCGGYAALKDLWKTDVYALAQYRNQISRIIPEEIIARAPSAELAPDQHDTDTLPAYDILDPILRAYIEQNKTREEIIASGFAMPTVKKLIKLVKANEYKRRQSPPGPRLSRCAFTRERRMPLTSGYESNYPMKFIIE